MKKILVVLSILGIAALALVAAGQAYAHGGTPPATPGAGIPEQGDFTHSGSHGDKPGDHESPLQPYMLNALSQEFGISVEELGSMHDSKATLWEYASEQGMSETEFREKLEAARIAALKQAAADGVISQEKVERMLSHIQGSGDKHGSHSGRTHGSHHSGHGQNAQPSTQP